LMAPRLRPLLTPPNDGTQMENRLDLRVALKTGAGHVHRTMHERLAVRSPIRGAFLLPPDTPMTIPWRPGREPSRYPVLGTIPSSRSLRAPCIPDQPSAFGYRQRIGAEPDQEACRADYTLFTRLASIPAGCRWLPQWRSE
jgi:hypothetical protein